MPIRRIAVLGAGSIGGSAARLLAAAGHEVAIVNARGPEALAGLLAEIGPCARTLPIAAAVTWSDTVFLAVPWPTRHDAYNASGGAGAFAGKLVIDAMNPYRADFSVEELPKPSSEVVAGELAGARLVKAFNTLAARYLADGARPAEDPARIAIPISGDDTAAVAAAAALIEAMGFDTLNTGPLAGSGPQEPGQPLYAMAPSLAELRAAFVAVQASTRPEQPQQAWLPGADGVTIHYLEAGSGDAVVLLHGWPQTSRAWLPIAGRLAARYRVIMPDLRGFGGSDKPVCGYDKVTVAEDIRAVLKALGVERAHLVGHDMGATVIYPWAARYPDEVLSVSFLDVPALGLADVPFPFDAWHFGFHQTPELPEHLTAGREREYLQHFFGPAYPGAIDDAALSAYVAAFSAPGAMRGGFEHYRAFAQDMADNRRLAESGPLTAPVLCLAGGALFGDFAYRVMQTACTDIRSVVLPGIGHWLPEEAPELVAEALLEHFGRAHKAISEPA